MELPFFEATMESNIRRNGPRQAAALMLRFESAPEEDTTSEG